MRLRISAIGLAIWLPACTGSDAALWTAGPHAMLDYQRGHFGVTQSADGKRRFTYVIPKDAFDSIIEDLAKREDQRLYMLSGWIGAEKDCPGSYRVTSRSEASSNIVYEGDCL